MIATLFHTTDKTDVMPQRCNIKGIQRDLHSIPNKSGKNHIIHSLLFFPQNLIFLAENVMAGIHY